ncbi:T9SS type A sorting domain-containing protein [bacterium]|nr:T9SS type A sorting domain-containing protein [bacterium]
MKRIWKFLFFAITFFILSINSFGQFKITTEPPNTNTSAAGVLFNLSTKETIRIDTVFFQIRLHDFEFVELWYRETPTLVTPDSSDFSSWKGIWKNKIKSVLAIYNSDFTAITIPEGLVLPAGSSYGFFLGRYTSRNSVQSNSGISHIQGVLPSINDGIVSLMPFVAGGSAWSKLNNKIESNFRNTSFSGGVSYEVLSKRLNDLACHSIDSLNGICDGNQEVYSTIENQGKNLVTSAQINWSVNGILQTPVNFSGVLDTLHGLNSNMAKVYLGNYNFKSESQDDIKVWTTLPNGVADSNNNNDTLKTKIATQMNGGNYTINANAASTSTNCRSFNELFDRIERYGICSTITVDVEPGSGPYYELVTIKNFEGSSTKRIEINGNGEKLINPIMNDSIASTFRIENSSFVTIDSLIVESKDVKYGDALLLHLTKNISILNCVFRVDSLINSNNSICVRVSDRGLLRIQKIEGYVTTIENFVFEGNELNGGFSGLHIYGDVVAKPSNVKITNNSFKSFSRSGIYALNVDDLTIERNRIYEPELSYNKNIAGVELQGCSDFKINRNTIHDVVDHTFIVNANFTGISISFGSLLIRGEVNNNLIYNVQPFQSLSGIRTSEFVDVSISNNTIVFDDTAASYGMVYGMSLGGAYNETRVQNNLIYITHGGGDDKYGIRVFGQNINSRLPLNISHNNIYLNSFGSGIQRPFSLSSANWSNSSIDSLELGEGNLQVDPLFKNTAIHDYTPTSPVINAAGIYDSTVITDLYGALRSPFKSDIGAIISESPVFDLAIQSFNLPFPLCTGNSNVDVQIQNNGRTKIDSVIINWSIGSVLQPRISYDTTIDTLGSVGGNQATINLTNYTFGATDTIEFKAWLTIPSGQINDENSINDTIIKKYRPALSGTYFLDAKVQASADTFTSFSDFSNMVSKWGMCGNVTLEMVKGSGPYNESVHFQSISHGPNDTLRINGNGDSLNYVGNVTEWNVAFSVSNCSNFILNDLAVSIDGTKGTGISLNDVENVIVSNCKVFFKHKTEYYQYIGIGIGSLLDYRSFTTANGVKILNNQITDGYSSIVASTLNETDIQNVLIEGNKIENFGFEGINFWRGDGIRIVGNEFTRLNRTNHDGYKGILVDNCSNLLIEKNLFHDIASTGSIFNTFSAIESNNSPSIDKTNYIMNNVIRGFKSSDDNISGFLIKSKSNEKYINNTFVLDKIRASGIAFNLQADGGIMEDIEISNNIIYLAKGDSTGQFNIYSKWAFDIGSVGASIQSNSIFIEPWTANHLAESYVKTFENIRSFEKTFLAKNNLNLDPKFKDLENGDLSPLNYRLKGTGKSNSKVTEDFYGAPRNPLALDRGAIAFTQPNLEVSVDSFNVPAALCPGNYPLSVFVSNEGFNRIDSLTVNYEINGVLQNSKSYNSIIENYLSTNGNVGEIPLGGFSINENETIRLKAWLTSVNGQIGDEYARNDTLEYTVVGKRGDAFNLNASSKLYNFEIGDQCWTTNGTNSSWQWGAPNSSFISAANTGVNAWVTNLSGNYNANELSYLESPSLDLSKIEASQPLQIQFFTSFSSEQSNDKMWLESSIDSGSTWQKVAPSLTANNFYNNSATQVWEGQSQGTNGWIPVSNEMLGLSGNANVKLRFAFQSNGSNQQDGFGIDDVQLNLLIGVPENEQKTFSMLMYPNPTNGDVKLEFNNSSIGEYMIRVFSISGKLMLEKRVSIIDKDQQTEALQLLNMSKGIYFVQVIGESGGVTKKLIVR